MVNDTYTPSTFKINKALRTKLGQMADVNHTAMKTILEEFIESGQDEEPTRTLYIMRTQPLTLAGTTWDTPFTGYVRVVFPKGNKMRLVEVHVEETDMNKFVLEVLPKIKG